MITTSKIARYRNNLDKQIAIVYNTIQIYKRELQHYSEIHGDIIAIDNTVTLTCKSYICKSIEYARLKGVYQTLIKVKHDLAHIECNEITKKSKFSIGKYVTNMTKRALRMLT